MRVAAVVMAHKKQVQVPVLAHILRECALSPPTHTCAQSLAKPGRVLVGEGVMTKCCTKKAKPIKTSPLGKGTPCSDPNQDKSVCVHVVGCVVSCVPQQKWTLATCVQRKYSV